MSILEKINDTILVYLIVNFLTLNQYSLLVGLHKNNQFICKLQYYPIFIFNYTKEMLYSKIIKLDSTFIKYNNIRFDIINNILNFVILNGKFITKMNLSKSVINDNILGEILFNCPNLESLILKNCHKISNISLYSISQLNIKIKYLDLDGIIRISEDSIIKILNKCKELNLLKLTIPYNFNTKSICTYNYLNLKSDYPNVKIIT